MLMTKDLSKSARPAEPAATEGPSFDAAPADVAGDGGAPSGADQGKDVKDVKAGQAPPARTQAQLLDASLLLSHWVEVDAFPASPSLLSVPRSPGPGGGGDGDAPPAAPGAPDEPPDASDASDASGNQHPNRGGAGAL